MKPLKNGKALILALKSSPIRYSDKENIGQMLKYVMAKIGIRANNLPDEFEKVLLINHIKTNFPNNTIDEIRLAFEMALNEDLDLSPDDVKCYENFSCAYFSRIMNAYVSWAANEIKFIHGEPPPQVIYTDEQIDNMHRQWTEEFYQRLRSGRMEEVPQYCHGILLKDGLLTPEQNPISFFVYKLGIGAKNIYEKI